MYLPNPRIFVKILLLLFTGLPVDRASADNDGGWYLTAAYYVTDLANTDTEDRRTTESCDLFGCSEETQEQRYRSSFDDDSHPGIMVGYDYAGYYRMEFEYREHEHRISAANTVMNESLDVKTLLFNMWRNFSVVGVNPYIGGGAGIGRMKQEKADDTFVLAQLGLGVVWQLNRRFAVDFGYRYFRGEPDSILESDNRELKRDLKGHNLLVGVRISMF